MTSKLDRATKEFYTLSEIERALKHEPLVRTYAEAGNLDAVHLIVDAQEALRLAQPTDIQLKTIELMWHKGLTLAEAGAELSVTPQAVKFNLDLLKVKLKKVVDTWKFEERQEIYND